MTKNNVFLVCAFCVLWFCGTIVMATADGVEEDILVNVANVTYKLIKARKASQKAEKDISDAIMSVDPIKHLLQKLEKKLVTAFYCANELAMATKNANHNTQNAQEIVNEAFNAILKLNLTKTAGKLMQAKTASILAVKRISFALAHTSRIERLLNESKYLLIDVLRRVDEVVLAVMNAHNNTLDAHRFAHETLHAAGSLSIREELTAVVNNAIEFKNKTETFQKHVIDLNLTAYAVKNISNIHILEKNFLHELLMKTELITIALASLKDDANTLARTCNTIVHNTTMLLAQHVLKV